MPRLGVDHGTVIFCHGFKGFWDWGGFPELLDSLAAAGIAAVGFSFSGSGVSRGDLVDEPERFADNTPSRQVDDLATVVKALRAGRLPPRGRDPGPIGIIGHSLGGGVAILYGAEDAVAEWRRQGWILVRNLRTGQDLHLSTAYLDDIDANGERLDILAAAARSAGPLLIVHGDADESVPFSEGEAIAAAAGRRATLLRIPNAGHTFGVTHPFAGQTPASQTAAHETVSWLRRHLRQTWPEQPAKV
jgi:pimeloyl-ACP methyl ester carboxylesterase